VRRFSLGRSPSSRQSDSGGSSSGSS
jgi:hypothetical protein